MTAVLACDLGGTSFRAALIDAEGGTIAEAAVPSPTVGGATEVDPEAWWNNLGDATASLFRDAPDVRPLAVAICGITRTQVFLDAAGRSLRPALAWHDTRAEAAASRLRDRAPGHPEAAALNAYHPAARLAWLAEAEAGHFRDLATVLEPKDYLNFRLTGARGSDTVSAARLGASAGPGPEGSLVSSGLLPHLHEPWEQVGTVRSGLPGALAQLAGIPVLCGANDTWAAVLGLGAMRAGCAYNISGTTEVLGVLGHARGTAEGLLSVDWRGLHQLGGPGQNGADTLSWLASVLRAPRDTLLEGPRQAQRLLFLPYLQGERVPHWDPALRGAFLGLGRQHGAVDLGWAVLEGVSFLNRLVLERAEAGMGAPVDAIHFAGGGAANPAWCQVKADVCRRPVVIGGTREPGVLGAAILAWTGLGRFPDLAAAQRALVHVAARYTPDLDRAAEYDALYALFRQADAALGPISHGLTRLAQRSVA